MESEINVRKWLGNCQIKIYNVRRDFGYCIAWIERKAFGGMSCRIFFETHVQVKAQVEGANYILDVSVLNRYVGI